MRILLKVTETNTTLKGLSMSRKKIGDEDGFELVKSLEKNSVLERYDVINILVSRWKATTLVRRQPWH